MSRTESTAAPADLTADATLRRPDPVGPARHRQRAGVPVRRRRGVATAVTGSLLSIAVLAVLLPRATAAPAPVVCGADAVQAEAIAGLADFSSWLASHRVPGYVGEVGWPSGADGAQWDAVAEVWYRAADRIGLPVTAWAAARWPASYRLGLYRAASGSAALDTVGPQSAVVEAHLSDRRALRGVVLAGGSFGTSSDSPQYSATNPGRYGHDYSYENPAGYQFLAARGVRLVRLAVAWERVQPRPGGPLSAGEVGRLRRAVLDASAAGLTVILDLHGYGEFVLDSSPAARTVLALGSDRLPTAALADFWSRMARATQDLPGLLGYDLLNEPARLASRGAQGNRRWEQASQEAVDAIRATGNRLPVFVSAYGRTSAAGWSRNHDRPWINDPAGRTVYEAHVYFDADGSGRYADSYSGALSAARTADLPRCQRLPDLTALHSQVLGRSPWWRSPARLFGASDAPPARMRAGSNLARTPTTRTSAARAGAGFTHEGRQ